LNARTTLGFGDKLVIEIDGRSQAYKYAVSKRIVKPPSARER
jgi:hypothetical protein